jgi:hypothetical protein
MRAAIPEITQKATGLFRKILYPPHRPCEIGGWKATKVFVDVLYM